jgi:hypothetical protein
MAFCKRNSNRIKANFNVSKQVQKLVTITDEAAVLSAVAAMLLAVFAVVQLRHMEKHRNVDISMKLFEWAETERLRKAFKWIDREFQFKNYEDYKKMETQNVEASEYPFEVLAFFEQVGFLVDKKFVDLNVVADRLGTPIISTWKKLDPWILAIRKEKNDDRFGEHFQGLHSKIVQYMKKN